MNYDEYNNQLFETFSRERRRILLNPSKPRNRSIFGIEDEADKTYRLLLNAFENSAITWSEQIAARLCELHSMEYYLEPASSIYARYDIRIIKDKSVFNILFSTNSLPRKGTIDSISRSRHDPVIVVLLIDNSESSQMIINSWQDYINQTGDNNISTINYSDFIRFFFGPEEQKASNEKLKKKKKKAREIIGLKITEVCTPEQKQSFIKTLKNTILNFDYKSVMDETHIFDDYLYYEDLETIRKNFLDNNRFLILLGEREFANTLLTSEWLFQKYIEQDGLDNTYMVTGYIKSVEQLLWNIIFLIGEDREIGKKHITIRNNPHIRTTMEDYCFFIKSHSNQDLCDESFLPSHRRFLMNALHELLNDYKNNCRNGYFHKDNLSAKDVENIRRKTFLLYFMLLGILNLNSLEISSLTND